MGGWGSTLGINLGVGAPLGGWLSMGCKKSGCEKSHIWSQPAANQFSSFFSMLNDYDCRRDRSIDCISKRMLLIVVVFGSDGLVQFSQMGKIKGMFNN